MSEETKFIGDAHWGKGGRYVIDPATGQRVPVTKSAPTPQTEGVPESARPIKKVKENQRG